MIGSVLLAAGLGTRLRPLTHALPKAALPVLDVPLGAWSLAGLLRAAPPVLVNASHLAAGTIAALEEAFPGASIETLVEEPQPYGTGGTLAALRERIGDRVVTANCDLVADMAPEALLRTHERLGTTATVAVAEVASGADLAVDGGRAVAFFDRRRRRDAPGVVFIGMAVYERDALALLPETRPVGTAEAILGPLARRGELGIHIHRGYYRDVGTPGAYLTASLDVLAGRAPPPPLSPEGTSGDGRYLGRSATIEGDAGDGAIVLRGAHVGPDAHIERSIIMPGERVPAGLRLHDVIWWRNGTLATEG